MVLDVQVASTTIDLHEIGARADAPTDQGVHATFGVYLPGIEQQAGYTVMVHIVHKQDRFVPGIDALSQPLSQVAGSQNTLWRAEVTIPRVDGTHFGQPGTYLYYYQLLQTHPGMGQPSVITRWFTDPFARATDIGELSAFTTPDSESNFVWIDETWHVPEKETLVVYEMHVEEFNSTFDGVVERLPYLKDLGVNCLELMPVTSLKLDFDWGYGPLHYFAPNERWGGPQGLKRLVNACHASGIAVILDVVYQHVDPAFPYHLVYDNAGIPSPMIHGSGDYGPEIDYNLPFAREYVKIANQHWLDEYHIDGFRYDEVTDLFNGPTGNAYAQIAFETYNASFKYTRFTPSGQGQPGEYSRIIQCAETLSPQLSNDVLEETYSNAVWQDGLLIQAQKMISTGTVDDDFVRQVILDQSYVQYPISKSVQDSTGQEVDMPVAPFQYLENHDHSQLVTFAGTLPAQVPFGDRSQFYKLQPFVIALYTSVGTPMLWQGQEFAENYVLPNDGNGRICYRRDVNWEYFYDEAGAALIRLYRIMGRLRRTCAAVRSHEASYYQTQSSPTNGIVAYLRRSNNVYAVVLLNFSSTYQTLSLPFPIAGSYREVIDADVRPHDYIVTTGQDNQMISVGVPSHYGYVFLSQ